MPRFHASSPQSRRAFLQISASQPLLPEVAGSDPQAFPSTRLETPALPVLGPVGMVVDV